MSDYCGYGIEVTDLFDIEVAALSENGPYDEYEVLDVKGREGMKALINQKREYIKALYSSDINDIDEILDSGTVALNIRYSWDYWCFLIENIICQETDIRLYHGRDDDSGCIYLYIRERLPWDYNETERNMCQEDMDKVFIHLKKLFHLKSTPGNICYYEEV